MWAHVEVDRAVERARRAALTDKLQPDPTMYPEGLGLTLPWPPSTFRRLTAQQVSAILERRVQERRS